MTNETMTIHRALSELKIIGDRIDNAIDEGIYCRANKQSNDKINGVPLKEFAGQIQGSFDKVTSLIKRRTAIKRAVVLSNATTQVSIGGNVMTVAEAIEMKNSGIEYQKELHREMSRQYASALATFDKENGEELQRRAENYVAGLYGQRDGKDISESVEKTRKEFIANNTYVLLDPINIKDRLNLLESEIAEFEAEVDSALSVSNALTNIEIEY